ncbi:hypothetical protein [Burkholderia vietnamiensis]|uniref:hypothetical protein n=1 Tax=Burkholderia vietnamiensis TaxID=60552 RepID=UPI001B9FF03D|nr:hypothetical protein [Burkholderia vietnamiensis]MBR8214702.1 hypothetical protein [Burkholderia vietnamiensis]MDN8065944.1 hypothetical protein [Burkholderia vietnamiensis]
MKKRHEIPDELGRFSRETLVNFYNLYTFAVEKIDDHEFVEKFVAPTRDTGSPFPNEIECEYEEARQAGLTATDKIIYLVRIGCARIGEVQRSRLNGDYESGWYALADANYFLGYILGGMPEGDRPFTKHHEVSRKGGITRHAKDPKQKDKRFVRECWEQWQQYPKDYKNKSDFARGMLDKCEHLKSEKVITDWCREWEAEKGSLPAK